MSTKFYSPGFLRLGLISLTLVSSAWAQSRPSLEGRILDPTLMPLSGAQVSIPGQSSAAFSGSSDDLGVFRADLAPGDYTVAIDMAGFQSASQVVSIQGTERVARDFVLSVAPVQTSVSVVEDSGYITPSITSAMKTPTLLQDTPQSITVIPR